MQLAAIERSGEAYRLRPVEGDADVGQRPARQRDGVALATGDVIEILGNRLEFVGAGGASASPPRRCRRGPASR